MYAPEDERCAAAVQLAREHGVQLRQLPDDVLLALIIVVCHHTEVFLCMAFGKRYVRGL